MPLFGQESPKDSITVKNNIPKIGLKKPESIVYKYTYNPQLNKYVYTQKLGEYDLSTPMFLSVKEYEDLVLRERMRAYYKEKWDAVDESKSGENKKNVQRDLLPDLYVNSDFFESIFGGRNIDIIPQGNVGIDLGVRYTKNDNPAITPRNRSTWGLDFDQRISLGLTGKIGTRLQLSAQYDTQASFDFQNVFKLEYEPNEDDIIQKVELGNISMPMSNSLITGSQSLFGVKTELKFGRTTITGVFSEQKSERKTVTAQGGGTVTEFDFTALDYDENRNFFLAQFFRDQYDKALENYPFINSKVQITRLEVWVTNRNNRTGNIRNILALQDLGEVRPENTRINQNAPAGFFSSTTNNMPANSANRYDPTQIGKSGSVLTDAIRDVATLQQGFGTLSSIVNQGYDYAVIENARKLEEGIDYKIDTKLGYISLNTALSSDEVLAVAYQYTYGSQVYQVGEFANDGISATSYNISTANNAITNNLLVLKMLKSNRLSVKDPIWDLMMKNVYSLGSGQLDPEDFRMNIYYSDPSPINYITKVSDVGWPTGLEDKILLNLFNFDRLNKYNDPQPGGDGFFDFLPGITVDEQYGKIFFTKVEPFGEFLHKTLGGGDYSNPATYNENQKKYVYPSLYGNTKTEAQMDGNKNKFQLKGRYKSSGRRGISLGAFNVPRGSVTVTAGGRILVEGIDYLVDYQSGTVEITNPSLEASNLPIQVSVENNLIFGGQTTRFMGLNIEHKINDKFILGASVVNLRERPYTQKTSYGQESVNNTIFGFGGTYSTELPFLTRLVNRIPTIKSDVASNLSVRGEFAYLVPGTPKGDDFDGETTVYLDDFESAQTTIDIRSPLAWKLASTPLEFGKGGKTGKQELFGTSPDDKTNLENGYGRAKMAWYTIDPIFYSPQKPSDVSGDEISKNSTRRIYIEELFPEQQVAQGQTLVQPTLDLAYYPNAKGQYNNNPAFASANADEKWAGIMRGMTYSDFRESNIEYIQFWMLDPYTSGEYSGTGELVFNLGNISEDVLKDGRKQYENGLPGLSSSSSVNTSSWGKTPGAQSLLYAFDGSAENRALQDVGLDGLPNSEEASFYTNNVAESPNDPALDNYEYYLARGGSILNRYYNYNGTEGNSPVAVGDNNRGSTTVPDYEDINADFTMNTANNYFEYRLPIKPNISRGDKYVNDIRTVSVEAPNGRNVSARWIQFKIPISEGKMVREGYNFPLSPNDEIDIINSITHMRMYMTGFSQEMLLRFGTLDLVRGDWRYYNYTLSSDLDDPSDDNTHTEINSVNLIENETRTPIPYVMPPGVHRERINMNNSLIEQNEQSLSYIVDGLESFDSRAVYKVMSLDLRQYKYIKMFVHAEAYNNKPLYDNQMVAFMRIGTDFNENYYQVEIPLQVTPSGSNNQALIWPNVNQLTIPMEVLTKMKAIGLRNQTLNDATYYDANLNVVTENTPHTPGENRYAIKGNPSLGSVRSVMIGVKNVSGNSASGEFWFNELRVAELVNNGGWAMVGALDANASELLNVSATGRMNTVGFGAVDQAPNQRAIESTKEYDVVMNVNAGKLLPSKWNMQIPVSLNHAQKLSTPEYDPVYQDIRLKDRLSVAQTPQERQAIKEQAENLTLRRGINLIGVKKGFSEGQKKRFYNIENFTFNYAYNEVNHHDYELEYEDEQNVRTGLLYNYAFTPKTVEPFKKSQRFSSNRYWKWLADLNLNLLPASVTFSSNITRSFTKQLFRDVYFEGVDITKQKTMPELQQRNYLMDYQVGINYNITRSLRVNFNATNNSIVRNYYLYDANGEVTGVRKEAGLWDNFWDLGDPNHFFSKFQVNYELPFSKFPFLQFIKANYTYSGDFDWQRGSQTLLELAKHDINTLQNANTHNLTANMSFDQLYAYLGVKPTPRNEKASVWKSLATMVKRAGINYSETNGTTLPGYTQNVGFLGTTKPSLGFMFGSQADIRYEMAKKGYLTNFADFNDQFLQSKERDLTITANLQPIPDLQIDLTAKRQYTDNYTETFEVPNQTYQKLVGNQVGNFNINTNLIATTFYKVDEYNSEGFEQFKKNRITVARRLATQRGINLNDPANIDADGYPKGFGKTNQAVMIPAFLAAYSGQSAEGVSLGAFKNIPIPEWSIRYTGLMRLEPIKKAFRRFSLSHAYRASYSLSEFRTNLEYDPADLNKVNASGDFLNEKLFTNVTLVEQFNPLLRADMEMKNSVSILAELGRERTISISLDNDYLTEIISKEYKLGLGYRIKDLRFVTKFAGTRTTLKSDLILKGTLSYRDEFTVIRNMEVFNNQVTAGQTSWIGNFSAEYNLSKSLLASYYLQYNFSKSAISTAFPLTTVRTGLSLRYTFN
ncbi:cell surface protein SprA [Capnocytophaga sp.]|uniref:T9SS outer membrane translocon Sov/SprA n=1 Tax=Capnocytophaga sp. TaxID=44737 RepID=UPI0026DCA451|nr:cell surface protein SprA [Capnocytophaga sp.]MDO5104255.1 cell surface protein SprA [Capnocytophaga sp.]